MKRQLILIDGISGSGKSTTAQYLGWQLEQNDLPGVWHHEEEVNHPLEWTHGDPDAIATREELAHFMEGTLEMWRDFVAQVQESEEVHIIESFLYQDTMRILFQNDLPEVEIQEFAQQMYEIIRPLDPALIYFYQQSVRNSLDRIWARRGDRWREWFIDADSQMLFAVNRGLSGPEASYRLWEEYQELTDRLFANCPFPKLSIDNTAAEWEKYRRQMTEFLGVEQYEMEVQAEGDLTKYCGTYQAEWNGKLKSCTIEEQDGTLRWSFHWPNIRMFPVAGDEWMLESLPIRVAFVETEQGVEKLRYTGVDVFGLKGKEMDKVQ